MADDAGLEEAAELFRVLGSPSRLRLLRAVADSPRQVGALAETTGMTQPLVSQHLRLLRSAGIVTVSRTGREAVYQLADRHIAHVIDDAVVHVQEPRDRLQAARSETDQPETVHARRAETAPADPAPTGSTQNERRQSESEGASA